MADNKVLIVEDDQNLLDVLKYNLMKEAYNVVTAADVRSMVDHLSSSRNMVCTALQDYLVSQTY